MPIGRRRYEYFPHGKITVHISFHLETHFGSTLWFNYLSISLYFWCMVSGIFFCGEAGEGGLSEYGGSDDIAGIMIS